VLVTSPHRVAAVVIVGLALLLAAFTEPGGGPGHDDASAVRRAFPAGSERPGAAQATPAEARPSQADPSVPAGPTAGAAATPRWRTERVLPDRGMLVAYYGTPGSGALGVLGETSPRKAMRRLRRAAAPFERPGRPVRPVFELIVSIADAHPGKDGDFSHDVRRAQVRRYVDAARELGAVLVLDIQPGRSDFLEVARRWSWGLDQPPAGLAVVPEWRMRRNQSPAG